MYICVIRVSYRLIVGRESSYGGSADVRFSTSTIELDALIEQLQRLFGLAGVHERDAIAYTDHIVVILSATPVMNRCRVVVVCIRARVRAC